ncbi:MAG: GTPase Era [Corynebacteriales bacterium]|nr:GTPase Era [Mycobacteriales bacterium]
MFEVPENFRAGFACFVGRPNAGKSTLTNALVGAKVAITSDKPQTTRHTIRGIVHRSDAQLVIVDTPGLHKPRTLLGERLNDLVRAAWSEVDVIGVCIPANEKVGPGDKFILSEIAKLGQRNLVGLVTKTDLVSKEAVAAQLLAVSQLADFAELVPVSAVKDEQTDTVAEVLSRFLPLSPPLYPDGEITDEPEQTLVAELIREAALEGVRDELPHSVAVVVEEMNMREGREDLVDIFANIYVERTSQKPIIVGARGSRIKDVGARARKHIEALLGSRVNLQLHVKIAKEWQRDPRQLRKLGF